MNALEVNALLAKAVMLDPRCRPADRTMWADQAAEWADVLSDIAIEDALAALNSHVRDSPEVVKPFHIVQGVKRIVADYNQRQASQPLQQVEHKRGWHPAPSREVMAIIGTAALAKDPVALARFRTAYRDELQAAGFNPDVPEGGTPHCAPSWDGRGQGKDFAIPLHDRD